MSNENEIQVLKEKLKMICNKIEEALSELKEKKEKNDIIKTTKIFDNDSNSKINTINKLKQKIIPLQNSLENIYNINNINKIESEIKKKIKLINKLKEEQTLLNNLIKKKKKDIENYSSKFTENREIFEIRNQLKLIKEEYGIKKESYIILNAKVKGQMSKIDILEKQINIIKQNIEYQKIKQKKEVEKSINNEEDNDENDINDNIESLENKEKMMIDDIVNEEKIFQNEIFQQNVLIENLRERINSLIEYKKKIKEDKKKENKLKKIKLIQQRNNQKNLKLKYIKKIFNTNGRSIDHKTNIYQTNKFNYKYGGSPNNSREINSKINFNKKPFQDIKFNEIYKNIKSHNFGKNKKNQNIYMSYYEQSLESKNENALRNLKHKNNISNDIEKLKNEITETLKNNIVIFNPSKNETDIKNNLNDEKISTFVINKELNIKNKNRPFEKFNFNQL